MIIFFEAGLLTEYGQSTATPPNECNLGLIQTARHTAQLFFKFSKSLIKTQLEYIQTFFWSSPFWSSRMSWQKINLFLIQHGDAVRKIVIGEAVLIAAAAGGRRQCSAQNVTP